MTPPVRQIVVGRGSRVWQRLVADPRLAVHVTHAIGHHELAAFAFEPDDRVWLFAYSRVPAENAAMIARLRAARLREWVIVSSASTIVATRTRCWEYPRVKQLAEADALADPAARVLTLGLMHDRPEELPAGHNAATRYAQLADFMLAPSWPHDGGRAHRLFDLVERPFASSIEAALYRAYGTALLACGRWPCALRPLDALLRAGGWRWYGYTHLSNLLWTRAIS